MLECDSRMMVAFIHSGLIKPQCFYTGFNGKQDPALVTSKRVKTSDRNEILTMLTV